MFDSGIAAGSGSTTKANTAEIEGEEGVTATTTAATMKTTTTRAPFIVLSPLQFQYNREKDFLFCADWNSLNANHILVITVMS